MRKTNAFFIHFGTVVTVPPRAYRHRCACGASSKGVHDSNAAVSAVVLQVLGINRVSSQRLRGSENGRIPIGDLESFGFLDGDPYKSMVNRLAWKFHQLLNPIQGLGCSKRARRLPHYGYEELLQDLG